MSDKSLKDQQKKNNNDDARKPDPETLHTTDPQEHMKGPVSSLVQTVREEMNEKGKETPKQPESDKK